MEDWWGGLDGAILSCLAEKGAVAPADLGQRLGMSETAVTSLICLLAQAGKVRICLVECRTASRGGRDVEAA